MRLIANISSKGGSGKTTLSELLAAQAAASGKSTLLLDLDPQQTAVAWFRRRKQETPGSLVVQAASATNINDVLAAAKGRKVELVVVDTPPTSSIESIAATKAADLVIVTVQPYLPDIETLPETFSVRGLDDKPAFVVFNRVPGGKQGQTILEQAARLVTRIGYEVARDDSGLIYVQDRLEYPKALPAGMTGAETHPPPKPAGAEIVRLYDWTARLLAKPRRRGGTSDPVADALRGKP